MDAIVVRECTRRLHRHLHARSGRRVPAAPPAFEPARAQQLRNRAVPVLDDAARELLHGDHVRADAERALVRGEVLAQLAREHRVRLGGLLVELAE